MRICRRVLQSLYNGRHGRGEAAGLLTAPLKRELLADIGSPVDADSVRPKHDPSTPDLPLLESCNDMMHPKPISIGHSTMTGACLKSKEVDDEFLLFLRKESCRLWVVRQDLPYHE